MDNFNNFSWPVLSSTTNNTNRAHPNLCSAQLDPLRQTAPANLNHESEGNFDHIKPKQDHVDDRELLGLSSPNVDPKDLGSSSGLVSALWDAEPPSASTDRAIDHLPYYEVTDEKPGKRKLDAVATAYDPAHQELPSNSYKSCSSPFPLDLTTKKASDAGDDRMNFLEHYPKGDATITYLNDHGESKSIHGLSVTIIRDRSPLIAESFEVSRSGRLLHLESLSTSTAVPFVRYLYTGSYANPLDATGQHEDMPTSLLLHCQLYRLGDNFDCLDLKQQAQVNVIRQCEFGCSSPDKPIDLCKAIEYAYEFLREHRGLLENIICYCVTCFDRHNLIEDFDFQRMAYKLRPFQQDLCRESMKRGFKDETASSIIRMPSEPYTPATYSSRDDLHDFVYHFHGDHDVTDSKRRKVEQLQEEVPVVPLSLPVRNRKCVKDAEHTHLESLIVLQGLPQVEQAQYDKLLSFIQSMLTHVGGVKPQAVWMPRPEGEETSEGVALVEYATSAEAEAAAQVLDNKSLDTKHTIVVNNNKRAAMSYQKSNEGQRTVASSNTEHWSVTVAKSLFPDSKHALQDYQFHLMLLEQENKKKLLMARQAQEMSMAPSPRPDAAPEILQAPVEQSTVAQEQYQDIPLLSNESDSEYEILFLPGPIEVLSNTDSESETEEMAGLEWRRSERKLPLRPHSNTNRATTSNHVLPAMDTAEEPGNDSESEWIVI